MGRQEVSVFSLHCQYADFFQELGKVEQSLKADRYMFPHYKFYVRESRSRPMPSYWSPTGVSLLATWPMPSVSLRTTSTPNFAGSLLEEGYMPKLTRLEELL